MNRGDYYSIEDVLSIYEIKREDYKLLLAYNNIPTLKKEVNLGTFTVDAVYALKTDIEKLGLTPKQPKEYKRNTKPYKL